MAEFLPGGRQGFEPRRVRELETILRKEPWCMFHKLVAGTLKIDNTYYCITDYNIYIHICKDVQGTLQIILPQA